MLFEVGVTVGSAADEELCSDRVEPEEAEELDDTEELVEDWLDEEDCDCSVDWFD